MLTGTSPGLEKGRVSEGPEPRLCMHIVQADEGGHN